MVKETNKSILIKMRKKLIEKEFYETRLNKINFDIADLQDSCRHDICIVTDKEDLYLGYDKYVQDRKYCLYCGKLVNDSHSIDIDMSNCKNLSDEDKVSLIRDYYTNILENINYISTKEVIDMLNSYANKTKEKVKLLEK